MSYEAFNLPRAFPISLHESALELASFLDQPVPYQSVFSANVEGEAVVIPYRIYDDPCSGKNLVGISSLQLELLHCLMTRHHSGLVREQHLAHILCLPNPWIPPFVVQLIGEYVIEILNVIHKNLYKLDAPLYRRFLAENRIFFSTTKQRVMSYWDCYHREYPKEYYVGFQIISFFDGLV
jgi:hypothetical protein